MGRLYIGSKFFSYRVDPFQKWTETILPPVIYDWPFQGGAFIVISFLLITFEFISFTNYVCLTYIQVSLGNGVATFLERFANSSCHLFIL